LYITSFSIVAVTLYFLAFVLFTSLMTLDFFICSIFIVYVVGIITDLVYLKYETTDLPFILKI